MPVGVFPHFFVVVAVVVLFVAVPAVLPFSVAFHHSSVDGPSELLTFLQLFSESPPLLDYRNFCNNQTKKMTTNFYLEEKIADTTHTYTHTQKKKKQ